MGSSTQRVPSAHAVDTDAQKHPCAQDPTATDARTHRSLNEPFPCSEDALTPIKLEERTDTDHVKREEEWHDASSTEGAFAGHIFLSLADLSSKYASPRPSTACVVASTVSSSTDLCCGSCHTEWTDVEAASATSSGRWFCLCCKRRLPMSAFSPEESKKRLLRRCKPCISKEPALEKALLAELPASIRLAEAVEAALAQIWTDLQQYERDTSRHVLVSSLFSDPGLLDLERCERQQRDQRAQHPPLVFDDWLVWEATRVSLAVEKTQLCSAMLRGRGVRVSSTAGELMKAASISQEAFEEDADVDECSAPTCGTCSASLESPPVAEEDVVRRLCHCCKRVLPDSVMLRIPLTDDDLICSSCRLCGSSDDAEILHSALSNSARIKSLANASDKLLARFILIDGEDFLFRNHTLKATTVAVSDFQRRRQTLSNDQRRALQCGLISVATSREMYAEAMDLEAQLLTALEGQVKLLLERAASLQLTVSDKVADVAQMLFGEAEKDSELRQLMDNGRTLLQGFASIPCIGCSAKLRAPRPSLSDAVCCDCCQRVLPESTLARSLLPDGTRVCRQCREQHRDPRKRPPQSGRPTRKRIEELEQAATGLAEICDSFEDTGRIPSGHVAVAKQIVRDCNRRRETVYELQRGQLAEGNTSAQVSYVMYNDRVDVDSKYVDALTKLIHALVEICNEDQLEVPKVWKDAAVRAENTPCRPHFRRWIDEEDNRDRRTRVHVSSHDVQRSTPYKARAGFARVRDIGSRQAKPMPRLKHAPGILGDFPSQLGPDKRPRSFR